MKGVDVSRAQVMNEREDVGEKIYHRERTRGRKGKTDENFKETDRYIDTDREGQIYLWEGGKVD